MSSFAYSKFIDGVWFLRRDIVSDGFDRALDYIKAYLPRMDIHRYKSGEEAWTWIIPEKWSVRAAYVKAQGKTLIDLKDHPLHVMSYSTPVSGIVSRDELLEHLHTRPDIPEAIPFEFSYYQKKWGFCVEHRRLPEFTADSYEVLIDSSFEPGELKVGSLFVQGETDEEIVLMAHLCHPSMVEDDLSGVSVLVKVAQELQARKNRFSYRCLFLPETIGSIAFLSRNEHLIKNMKYGVFLEMLGHDDKISLQKSKIGDTVIDRAAELVLKNAGQEFRVGNFLEVIQNDERVLNGPGVGVPTISFSRAKFWGEGSLPYPEYHSSADTPAIVSEDRLKEAEKIVLETLRLLEANFYPKTTVKGPIFLSRYGLWVDWRINRNLNKKQWIVFDYLEHGKKSVVDMAYELDVPFEILGDWLEKFYQNQLIEKQYDTD